MSAAPLDREPLKRSSVHHLHAHERATFTVQHGWEIAASFGDAAAEQLAARQAVAVADVSWLGKLECKGPWAASLASERVTGAVPCPVTPERLLWIVEARCYVIDTSSVYASFELVGPHINEVLC